MGGVLQCVCVCSVGGFSIAGVCGRGSTQKACLSGWSQRVSVSVGEVSYRGVCVLVGGV